jgi:hypothetical protein
MYPNTYQWVYKGKIFTNPTLAKTSLHGVNLEVFDLSPMVYILYNASHILLCEAMPLGQDFAFGFITPCTKNNLDIIVRIR